jgi:acyl phosphate:glycerol-3-phosphate acyltransferase
VTAALTWQAALIAIVGGYLLGSIPFGYLLSRVTGLGDIRAIGSGNIGATNVLRTGRKDVAAATLLLDGGKGALAVLAWTYFAGPLAGMMAGVASVAGHCTSIWMRGNGGKGVATGLGMILGTAWPVGLGACVIWLAAARLTRRSSAGSLIAFAAAPVLMLLWAGVNPALAVGIVSLIVFVRHEGNIRRLLAGTEPRIGQGK